MNACDDGDYALSLLSGGLLLCDLVAVPAH